MAKKLDHTADIERCNDRIAELNVLIDHYRCRAIGLLSEDFNYKAAESFCYKAQCAADERQELLEELLEYGAEINSPVTGYKHPF